MPNETTQRRNAIMEAQSFIFLNLLNLFIMATLKVLTHLNLAEAKASTKARFRFYIYTDTNDAVVLEALLKEEEATYRTDLKYDDDTQYNFLKEHVMREKNMAEHRWFVSTRYTEADVFFIPYIDKSWQHSLTPIEKIVKTFYDRFPLLREVTTSNYQRLVLSWGQRNA
jgi:hypothetical protein